jgi:hypothetical protein
LQLTDRLINLLALPDSVIEIQAKVIGEDMKTK